MYIIIHMSISDFKEKMETIEVMIFDIAEVIRKFQLDISSQTTISAKEFYVLSILNFKVTELIAVMGAFKNE